MTSITVIMVVHNEAHRVRAALENVRPYVTEIILVDQMSDDGTLEQAGDLPDVVIYETFKGEAEPDRKLAAARARGDWILVQDADELWTDDFLQQLDTLTARPDVDAYRILRRTQVEGYPAFDEHMMRFHRRGKAEYPEHIHCSPRPLGPTYDLDFVCMLHRKSQAEQIADEVSYEATLDVRYADDPAYKDMKRLNFVTHPERGFWQVRRIVAEAVQP